MSDAPAAARVEVRVLGAPRVLVDGVEVESLAPQRKRLALLCHLALQEPGAAPDRDALVALFWPDLEPGRGRAALRQSIYYLRKSIGPGVLGGKGDDAVELDRGRVRTDAEAFEAALERGEPEEALGHYRGEFLSEFEVDDVAPAWREWVAERRARYRREAVAAAVGLAESALRRREPLRALRWAERALQIEPGEPRALEIADAVRTPPSTPGSRGSVTRVRRPATLAALAALLALVGWGAWSRFGDSADGANASGASAEDPAEAPFVEPRLGGLHDLRIVFDSTRDGNNEIYAINADGTELLRLTHHPGRDVQPRWAPDRSTVAFVSDRDGNPEIYVMDPMGSDVRRLTSDVGVDEAPRFSPDGSKIVWASDRNGSLDLYLMDADGTNLRRLTSDPADETRPTFFPDGHRIAFEATIGSGGNPAAVDVFVIDLESSGPPVRLNDRRTYDDQPDVSPDGSRIVFSSTRDGSWNRDWGKDWNREIYVMSADGTGERKLTNAEGWDGDPRWSPDGATILFRSDRTGRPELYVMEPDGSNVRRITRRGARRADWAAPPEREPDCLLVNGSFEEVEEDHSRPDGDTFYGVPGWRPSEAFWVTGGAANSPDLFVAPEDVPDNHFGYLFPAHGRNYAGVSHSNHGYATESLAGTLRERLRAGNVYEIRAFLSNSQDTSSGTTGAEIHLYSRRTGESLRVDRIPVDNDQVWIPYTRRVRIAPDDTNGYDEIVFRGFDRGRMGRHGYFFLDDVDVCPVD